MFLEVVVDVFRLFFLSDKQVIVVHTPDKSRMHFTCEQVRPWKRENEKAETFAVEWKKFLWKH